MPTDPLADFVALSSALTGIDGSKLRPALDTYGTAQTYFDYATNHGGAQFVELMAVYQANRSKMPEEIGRIIIENTDANVTVMAQAVMLMWYLGAWYEPDALKVYVKDYQAGKRPFAPSVIISSDAYTQGWAWKVGQAHPMGYSELRFGYWGGDPVALQDLVGDASQ